jgi:4-hydroxy-tetrahydrodipicolinate synthase
VAYLQPLVRDLFIETNPAPVKAALALMELCSAQLRLPLVELEPANHARLQASLSEAGLLRRK